MGYTAAAYITVAGTVDFYYHIDSMMTLPANPNDALNRLSMSVFAITDLLSVQAAGPGNAPDATAILHTNGVLDVNFNTNPITNGMTSETIWLITNATAYDLRRLFCGGRTNCKSSGLRADSVILYP